MTATIAAIAAIIGILGEGTRYTGPVGNPLFCSPPGGPDLHYTAELLAARPWVALAAGGPWSCGDPILVIPRNAPHQAFLADALDAGPWAELYVATRGSLSPIVVDVPTELAPWTPKLSAPVVVVNLRHVAGQLAKASTCTEAQALAAVRAWARGSRPAFACATLVA